MNNVPHWSLRTIPIIKRVYNDPYMSLYNTSDPLYELINYSLAHESDLSLYKLDKISDGLNIQTCDLNEPCFLYKTIHSDSIIQPLQNSGIVYDTGGITEYIAINYVDNVTDLYSTRPTRLVYNSGITLSIANSGIGILYAHNRYDRYGKIYLVTDTNPGDSGSLYELDNDLNIVDSGYIARINTYSSTYYRISQEDWAFDTGVGGNNIGGSIDLEYIPTSDFKLYDLAHLNHSGMPIEVSTDEYTLSGNTITLQTLDSGRPSYNASYYDDVMQTGQPDYYWNGYYAATFSYVPFTGINNGLSTNTYFNMLSDNENELLYPNTPKNTGISIPYQPVLSTTTGDIALRTWPKFFRPENTATVRARYTKLVETTWDPSIAFDYDIVDTYFYETGSDAVKVYMSDTPIIQGATITNNNVYIDALDSGLLSAVGSSLNVQIYYLVEQEVTVTGVASYTYSATNYSNDYAIDELGRIIPYTVVEADFDGIDEEYSNPKIELIVDYDLKGLAYDPYRNVFWSFENNGKYLTARDPITLNIITNVAIFKNPRMRTVELEGLDRYIVDYSPQYTYDIVSIKILDNYMYLLSDTNTLYILDLYKELPFIDIEVDTDDNFVYTPIVLEDTITGNVPVDFTFNKNLQLLLLYSNGKINIYDSYFDYALVDSIRNEIIYRERYDNLTEFNIRPFGYNRVTDFDKMLITYINDERKIGENLHELYDRVYKRFSPITETKVGCASTKQGMYNAISYEFDLEPHQLNSHKFVYLSNMPVDYNEITGDDLLINVYADNTLLPRLGSHADNVYDSGESGFVYEDSFKYTDLYSTPIDTGFIVWRNYDGSLSNIVEINYTVPYSGITVDYAYIRELDGEYVRRSETFETNLIQDTGTAEYDILPIYESFLYDSGTITDSALPPIYEMLRKNKRHWGYFTIDDIYMATHNFEQRKDIMCYDIIDTGIITGG